MRLFWVVAWSNYYPCGGLGNVQSTHVTLEEAEIAAQILLKKGLYNHVEVEDISAWVL